MHGVFHTLCEAWSAFCRVSALRWLCTRSYIVQRIDVRLIVGVVRSAASRFRYLLLRLRLLLLKVSMSALVAVRAVSVVQIWRVSSVAGTC